MARHDIRKLYDERSELFNSFFISMDEFFATCEKRFKHVPMMRTVMDTVAYMKSNFNSEQCAIDADELKKRPNQMIEHILREKEKIDKDYISTSDIFDDLNNENILTMLCLGVIKNSTVQIVNESVNYGGLIEISKALSSEIEFEKEIKENYGMSLAIVQSNVSKQTSHKRLSTRPLDAKKIAYIKEK